jgi:hypothetical protein
MKYVISILLTGLMLLLVGCGQSEEEKFYAELAEKEKTELAYKAAADKAAADKALAEKAEYRAKLAQAGIVSLNEISGGLFGDAVSAEQVYKDKKLTILGEIISIGEHDSATLTQAEGPAYMLIQGERPLYAANTTALAVSVSRVLLCEVDLSDVLTLETKTRVVVTGIFHPNLPEWVGYGPDYWLEGCSIVTDQYIGIVSK